MCVAMVIIHTKTLEKKAVDDVASTESLQLHESPTMSQGTALFSFGIMESGRWPEVGGVCGVQQRPVGSSLESLWDSMRETCSAREAGAAGGLLRDLRDHACGLEKRRCHSGGSVQRGAFAPSGFPAMQRSSSFSLPTRINPPETFSHGFPFAAFSASPQTPQALYLSHEQICPTEFSSPDSTPELERRHSQGLARSRSQPCVHNDKKTGVKRRRPADSHKHRPSLDLLKMTQKLQDFHSLSCPGFAGDEQTLHDEGDVTPDRHQTKEDTVIHQSEASWPAGRSGGKERECLWAGLCSRRGRDSFQLGGELDIEQIERN
ncbi:hypothetical protein cypCar_00035393 [Cyprinus carpio]|nr:hypothetical protein cypCar_00035393 [Cyprinus carpio]